MKRNFSLYGWLLFFVLFVTGCGANGRLADSQAFYYLGWDSVEHVQLFAASISGDDVQQLTNETAVILTYAVSSQNEIVYVAVGDGRDGLWLLPANGRSPRQILACSPTLSCDHPVWHPDGLRLLYERDQLDDTLPPTLFWLDVRSEETKPLHTSEERFARAATFSPDGEWVSYYAIADEEIQAFRFASQQQLQLTSQTGHPAAWNAQASLVLFNNYHVAIQHSDAGDDHTAHDHTFEEMIRLYRMDVDNGRYEPLSEATGVADMLPTWSPDGEWITFLRGAPKAAAGQQIWLIRPDGSAEQPLTDDMRYQHGSVSWSANGRYLLFQKFDTTSLDDGQKPAVELLHIETGQAEPLIVEGFAPQWQPVTP